MDSLRSAIFLVRLTLAYNFQLTNERLEAVGWGPDQGRRVFETGGVALLRRGLQRSENTGLDQKMPFLDGHYRLCILTTQGVLAILAHAKTPRRL